MLLLVFTGNKICKFSGAELSQLGGGGGKGANPIPVGAIAPPFFCVGHIIKACTPIKGRFGGRVLISNNVF